MTDKTSPPHAGLTRLHENESHYPARPEDATLEAFDNAYPHRNYWIEFDCPEFTALCPITGQPDFGHIVIRYIPDKLCVESKALKLYLFSFRNHGTFHEEVVNRILEDLVATVEPREAIVTGRFNRRGGIAINVEATYPDR